MSEQHDLNVQHDLNQDVANNTSLTSSHLPAHGAEERNVGLPAAPLQTTVRRNRHHQQNGRMGNGYRIPVYTPVSRANGFNQMRKPVIDPTIREQRRIFYQSHYNRIDNENNNNQSTKRYRSFRSRTAQSSNNNAQCDPNRTKIDQAPVCPENGPLQSGIERSEPTAEQSAVSLNRIVGVVRDRNRGHDRHSHSDQRRHETRHDKGLKKAETSDGREQRTENKGRKKKETDSEKKRRDKSAEEVKDEAQVVPVEQQQQEEVQVDDGAKDCPLCLEPLDPTECNLYPCCFCKFQICLFCLNRLKEEVGCDVQCQAVDSEKRLCGSCPGCRNPYPADSDDESMAIAIRMTKKRTKAAASKAGNRSTNSKPETTVTEKTQHNNRTQPGNQRPGVEILPQAKRPLPRNDHRVVDRGGVRGKDRSTAGGEDRWSERGIRQSSSSSSHSRRDGRRPTRRQVSREKDGTGGGAGSQALDQKQDATSIKQESTEEKKQELVSLLSSLGLSPCNIRFHPQRQES